MPSQIEEEEEGGQSGLKKGCKQKKIYGIYSCVIFKPSINENDLAVDNAKWYRAKKMKPDVAALIAKTSEEQDFHKREKVYDSHREELQTQFRYFLVKVTSRVVLPTRPSFSSMFSPKTDAASAGPLKPTKSYSN